MNKIIVQSPTRVDLAGGTLDLWPLYNFVGGALTVNVAIDIWTKAEITELPGKAIELESIDLSINKKYKNLEECLSDTDSKLALLQAQLRYWKPEKGFHLMTSSQSPVGGGLGGSSSLTISLIKAFRLFCKKRAMTVPELVDLAHNIESQVLHTPTGTQDYFPAVTGGLNILNYSLDGISHKVLSTKGSKLEENFLLVHTGKSHHSGLNNFEVLKSAIGNDSKTMAALFSLKLIAAETAEVCQKQKWSELPGLFQREFAARIQLTPAFSSPEIEQLQRLSLQAGALGVKICGAGGGGCVLIWVEKSLRERVSIECQKSGFKVLSAKPVEPLAAVHSTDF